MKILNYLFFWAAVSLLMTACEKGIDPINSAPQGTDELAPTLTITYPVAGKPVASTDEVATVFFKMLAEDDIELQSVKIVLDGTEIGNLTSFKDYRRAVIAFEYKTLVDGDHNLTVTATDLTGKSVEKSVDFKKVTLPPYTPMEGEVFYLPFENNFIDVISANEVPQVGSPAFTTGKVGDCYQGVPDAYLKYPSKDIVGPEFSISFWYKINPDPVRGGIIAISPEGDSRSVGLRMFHENSGDKQNIGLNIGIGSSEVWMNPFVKVATNEDWIHIAISISTSKAIIYVNNAVAQETDLASPIDWTGCPSISIGSGAPNFTYWDHFSDNSLYDELKFFKKAITADEVNQLYSVK